MCTQIAVASARLFCLTALEIEWSGSWECGCLKLGVILLVPSMTLELNRDQRKGKGKREKQLEKKPFSYPLNSCMDGG